VRVMGVDPSLTCTGVVVLNNDEVISERVSSKARGIFRAIEIADRIAELILIHKPNVAYIEGYSFGSTGQALYQIGELGGLIRERFCEIKGNFEVVPFDWQEIPPAQVKKFCTGKGNTKKEDMKLHAYKRWGIELRTNDEIDAFVLAKIAEAIYLVKLIPSNIDKYTSFQQEVIVQLTTGKKPVKKKRGLMYDV